MTTEQLEQLAEVLGVQRRGMSDEQLADACIRAARTVTGNL